MFSKLLNIILVCTYLFTGSLYGAGQKISISYEVFFKQKEKSPPKPFFKGSILSRHTSPIAKTTFDGHNIPAGIYNSLRKKLITFLHPEVIEKPLFTETLHILNKAPPKV